MRNTQPLLILLLAVAISAGTAAAEVIPVAPLVALARRADLRVLEGRHLSLATDRPPREGDGVTELPQIFDQACDAWCAHYGIDPQAIAAWRVFGCLVVDRERIRAAGLLPDGIPDFANGFCDRNRFWMMDQSNPAYRRHLLLHEGVHAFTITVRNLGAPVWYTEGIAECLATHRLGADEDGRIRFESTPVPLRAADVEQLGRIEKIRELRRQDRVPGLADVLATPSGEHHEIAAYASSWAAVALLARHPAHAARFAAVERGVLDAALNDRLAAAPGWDAAQAARDFDAFTDDIDYGYDFARSAVDWSPGAPLRGPRQLTVQSTRGWQNTGASLVRGSRYAIAGRGRVTVGSLSAAGDAAGGTVLQSSPDGISLRWYRGRPVGRLLAAQWVAADGPTARPRFVTLAEGTTGEFAAATDGPLYLKLNEAPGDLHDNEGELAVELRPAP